VADPRIHPPDFVAAVVSKMNANIHDDRVTIALSRVFVAMDQVNVDALSAKARERHRDRP
jgi:hypothetical protein